MGYFEDRFNESIEEIMEKMQYDAYWIHIFQDIQCTCVNYDSKVPNADCKKCLGTGNKIKIKKIKVSSNESDIPNALKPKEQIMIDRLYYIKYKHKIEVNDIIVDTDDDIHYVYQKASLRSFSGEKLYHKCVCPTKKLDTIKFLKNFHGIVGDTNA